jgi:hypothetical protein
VYVVCELLDELLEDELLELEELDVVVVVVGAVNRHPSFVPESCAWLFPPSVFVPFEASHNAPPPSPEP